MSYGITARAAFGKKSKDEREFIINIKKISKLIADFCLADLYPSIKMLRLISGVKKKLEKLHKAIDRIHKAWEATQNKKGLSPFLLLESSVTSFVSDVVG